MTSHSTLLKHLKDWSCYPCAAVVYVDLRDIRSLNRIASPKEGDAVIEAVTHLLRDWSGTRGVSGRLWSNEFVATRVIDHAQAALDEASALRDQLAALRYRSPLGDSRLAVAMGLVVVKPGVSWPKVIADAAEACQCAKRRGVNQIYSSVPQEVEARGAHISAARVLNFRQLMAEGRLSLHPQPIMDIRGAQPRLAKAEFLLRAEDNGRFAPLPPGSIETLEFFGLTSELDGFCTQQVLEWLAENPSVTRALDSVSMNLSAKSIVDGNFMDGLHREVRHARVPPEKLCFEITETAAIEHLEVAAEVITAFKSLGCRFSLDDFGSGLCSFGYLQSLPVDEVKIDGRFTREVAVSDVSQEIVRAIHQVAKATGKKTVAEFVDQEEKLSVLRSIGVDYAQGWLFYPAIPPERFLKLLEAP